MEDDINDYIPSLLHPRRFKKGEGDPISQASSASRLSLALKKIERNDKQGLKLKPKPLGDRNRSNSLEKTLTNIAFAVPAKENIHIENCNERLLPPTTTPKKRRSCHNKAKKRLQEAYDNTAKELTSKLVSSKPGSAKKHKSFILKCKDKENGKEKLLMSKKTTRKYTSVNIELDTNNYEGLTLDTDAKTVIKRLSIINKDNIMEFNCILENKDVIILSDSDDDFIKSSLVSHATKTNGANTSKIITEEIGYNSKDSENKSTFQLPTKRSKVELAPPKKQVRKRPSQKKKKTNKNDSKCTKNNLNSSFSSNKSSLKQSSILSFMSANSILQDDSALLDTQLSLSEASTYILKGSNGANINSELGNNLEGKNAASSSNLILKEEELLIDDDLIYQIAPEVIISTEEQDVDTRRSVSCDGHDDAHASRDYSPLLFPEESDSKTTAVRNINYPLMENNNGRNSKKAVPSYKIIEGTPFAVDAFCYGNLPNVAVYFLTHFHSDHYMGLRKTFNKPLYCTRITAELCKMKLGVNKDVINILELDETIILNGIEITAVEANHCPGSIMLVFSLTNGENILHCGDFRANNLMESYPILWTKDIQTVYLDTTYCNPRYDFPSQGDSIIKAIEILRLKKEQMEITGFSFKRVLIICGTYYIGKENFFKGIAEAFDCQIWAGPEKSKVLKITEGRCFNSASPSLCQLHVVNMAELNFEHLSDHLRMVADSFDEVIAFRPTGWQTNKINCRTRGNISIYGIPYSEHSSYSELKRFVKFLKPNVVIPTVPHGKQDLQKHIQSWLNEKNDIQTRVSDYFKTVKSKSLHQGCNE